MQHSPIRHHRIPLRHSTIRLTRARGSHTRHEHRRHDHRLRHSPHRLSRPDPTEQRRRNSSRPASSATGRPKVLRRLNTLWSTATSTRQRRRTRRTSGARKRRRCNSSRPNGSPGLRRDSSRPSGSADLRCETLLRRHRSRLRHRRSSDLPHSSGRKGRRPSRSPGSRKRRRNSSRPSSTTRRSKVLRRLNASWSTDPATWQRRRTRRTSRSRKWRRRNGPRPSNIPGLRRETLPRRHRSRLLHRRDPALSHSGGRKLRRRAPCLRGYAARRSRARLRHRRDGARKGRRDRRSRAGATGVRRLCGWEAALGLVIGRGRRRPWLRVGRGRERRGAGRVRLLVVVVHGSSLGAADSCHAMGRKDFGTRRGLGRGCRAVRTEMTSGYGGPIGRGAAAAGGPVLSAGRRWDELWGLGSHYRFTRLGAPARTGSTHRPGGRGRCHRSSFRYCGGSGGGVPGSGGGVANRDWRAGTVLAGCQPAMPSLQTLVSRVS